MKVVMLIVANYFGVGAAFTLFYVILARRVTTRGVLREFFLWPHRVWKGAKVIYANAGKTNL